MNKKEIDILRLVYDYTKNGKIVDRAYIDKLVSIVVINRSLNDYVSGVYFEDNGGKQNDDGIILANYSMNSKYLTIYGDNVNLALEARDRYTNLFANDFEVLLYRNLSITQFVLHELEHAYQVKKVQMGGETTEKIILRAAFKLELALQNPKFDEYFLNSNIMPNALSMYIKKYNDLYERLYVFNPTERMAQIDSYETILLTIEHLKSFIPSLYEYIDASLWEERLKAYIPAWNNDTSCPTEMYLNGIDARSVWTGFDFYYKNYPLLRQKVKEKYDLQERLRLGLPVDFEEYDKVDRLMRMKNKFNC